MAGLTLATKPEFVEMREDFYQWWSDVAASGMSASDARVGSAKKLLIRLRNQARAMPVRQLPTGKRHALLLRLFDNPVGRLVVNY
jgi:hypothetical protein